MVEAGTYQTDTHPYFFPSSIALSRQPMIKTFPRTEESVGVAGMPAMHREAWVRVFVLYGFPTTAGNDN